ncbi:MAG: M20 family metallopeptidase [Balneolaceae bacterium]
MSVTFRDLSQKAEEYHSYMIEIRRHLHRNPEVSYREHDTTEFILEQLAALGIRTERPLETGCVGILPGTGDQGGGRVIALRADIDALAMDEQGDHKKEFMSVRPGAAHCCGHDAHTANLLGAAKILADFSEWIDGTVLLVFQPGEEKLPGGGRLLSESGFLQKYGVEAIYGLHTSPMHAPGTVATRSGPMMARPDEFEIELIGKGGHAASPHQTVDPVVMAAEAIQKFQTVISRNIEPTEPAVLTVGRVVCGSTYNVIAAKAHMEGTVRSFNRETAHLIRDRMEQILKGIAGGSGGDYKFQFNEGYPAVTNDRELTAAFRKTAAGIVGEEGVLDMKRPVMAGEDFAFYQEHFPGTFFFLGSGSSESSSTWSWHHPEYNIDERCFLTGAPLMAAVALGM